MQHLGVRIGVPYLILVGMVALLLGKVSPEPPLCSSFSDALIFTGIVALPQVLFWRFGLQPLFRILLHLIPFAPSKMSGMMVVMNNQPQIVEQTLSVIPQPTMFGVVAMAMYSTGYHEVVWGIAQDSMVVLMLLSLFWHASRVGKRA